jgi:hypothetical protein
MIECEIDCLQGCYMWHKQSLDQNYFEDYNIELHVKPLKDCELYKECTKEYKDVSVS